MNNLNYRWTGALILGAFASVSISQTNSITPYRQIATGPATVMTTADFSPQINPRVEFTARPLSPNSSPKPIPNGSFNFLKAGSVTTTQKSVLGTKFPGIGFTGWVPPDPNIAVGPNHIVSVVNSDIAFFNKSTGVKTFQQTGDGNGFFSGIGVQTTFVFDPKCYYDRISGRFIVLFLELDSAASVSKILLAVSDDSDPNGTWFKYRIEAKVTEGSNSWWMDYPGLGVNKDAIVISGNMFPLGSASGVFTSVVVLPKAPLLTGGSSTGQYLKDTTMFTLQPARTADSGQAVMYGVAATSTSTIRVVAISNLLGVPTLTGSDVSVPAWTPPGPVPAGGGRQLDGLDGRLYTAHFRNGRIVTSHTTKAGDGRMQSRWYEFAVNSFPGSGNPSLRQSGNILLAGTNSHMPAVNINAVGDISVIYTRSNGATNPETCVSSRQAIDQLGTIGAPVLLASSAGTYGGGGVNRWGDYFTCEIDPTDQLTFWGVGMVGDAGGNWTTHINKWTVSNGAASLVDPIGISTIQGNYQSGDLAAVKTSNNVRYTLDSVMIDRTGQPTSSNTQAIGQSASVRADFDLDLSGGPVSDLKVVVEANVSPAGATGQVFAFDWTTSTYRSVASFAMNATDRTSTLTIPKTLLAKYIDATGNVRILVRGFHPVRSGRPGMVPPQFLFNIDRVALGPLFIAP